MKKMKTGTMRSLMLSAVLALGIVSCSKDEAPVKDPGPVAVDYHQTAATQFIEAGGTKKGSEGLCAGSQ
jgi:hypothetical protein